MSTSTRTAFCGQLASGDNALCTAIPAGQRSTVTKCHAYNADSVTRTVYVNIVPNGGSVGSTNKFESKTLQAGESWSFPGIVGSNLDPGQFANANASAATAINFMFCLSDKT